MALKIPDPLAAACRVTPERAAWLERLPDVVRNLQRRWTLTVGAPFESEVSCAWVAPSVCADGSVAVLKIGMPHMEGRHEIDGLRFWDGDPTVRLIQADADLNAMLLEPCRPGTPLRAVPEAEQDVIIARLLQRLWRRPPPRTPFRPLSDMTTHWSQRTRPDAVRRFDAGLIRDGLRLFDELPRTAPTHVVLATDLHAGNVLRAEREPWLVIDPKPFVGDPAYDATQHLLNCESRMRADPDGTILRFAELLGLDHERIRLWTFARLVVASRDDEFHGDPFEVARAIAP